ncbi:MAG: helix-turn-helix domain-containing protein [Sedimentibacter sp.]
MSTIRLRQERINKGWTLEYVANKLNVTKQSICDWEHGRHIPTYKVLSQLENLFNLSHRDLLQQVPDENILSK